MKSEKSSGRRSPLSRRSITYFIAMADST
jgi:hypothetical protein